VVSSDFNDDSLSVQFTGSDRKTQLILQHVEGRRPDPIIAKNYSTVDLSRDWPVGDECLR